MDYGPLLLADKPLPLGNGSLIRHGAKVRPDPVEGLRPKPADAQKVLMVAEGTVQPSGFDDAFRQGLADLRQLNEFWPIGRVDVHFKVGGFSLGPPQFDHASKESAAEPPPSDRAEKPEEDEHGHGRLIGPPEPPDRPPLGARDGNSRGVFDRRDSGRGIFADGRWRLRNHGAWLSAA